jgi:hypothetical protein
LTTRITTPTRMMSTAVVPNSMFFPLNRFLARAPDDTPWSTDAETLRIRHATRAL